MVLLAYYLHSLLYTINELPTCLWERAHLLLSETCAHPSRQAGVLLQQRLATKVPGHPGDGPPAHPPRQQHKAGTALRLVSRKCICVASPALPLTQSTAEHHGKHDSGATQAPLFLLTSSSQAGPLNQQHGHHLGTLHTRVKNHWIAG